MSLNIWVSLNNWCNSALMDYDILPWYCTSAGTDWCARSVIAFRKSVLRLNHPPVTKSQHGVWEWMWLWERPMVRRSSELHLCPDSPRFGQLWGAEQLRSANPNRQTLWTQVFCCCWTANHMSKVSSHPESGHSTQECSITLDYTVCFFPPLAGCGQLAFGKRVVKYSEKGQSRLFQLRCKFPKGEPGF